MIGSLLIAGSLLGQWSIAGFSDDPRPKPPVTAEHPEPVGRPWKPIGPLPERIAPKPETANIPKLKPDLPPIPPALDPVPMTVPPAPPILTAKPSLQVEYTAMAEAPPTRRDMAAGFPPPTTTPAPKAETAECRCEPGQCSCCDACSCGGSHAATPPVVTPPVTAEPMTPTVYYMTDRFGMTFKDTDQANLQAWIASRNAMQPAVWSPTLRTGQAPLYYRSGRRGFFRVVGSASTDGACQ